MGRRSAPCPFVPLHRERELRITAGFSRSAVRLLDSQASRYSVTLTGLNPSRGRLPSPSRTAPNSSAWRYTHSRERPSRRATAAASSSSASPPSSATTRRATASTLLASRRTLGDNDTPGKRARLSNLALKTLCQVWVRGQRLTRGVLPPSRGAVATSSGTEVSVCRRHGIVGRVQACRYRAVAAGRLSIPPALQGGRVPHVEALETDPPLTVVRRW